MLRDPRGEVGMRYLTGRKLTDETMHHFGLGYAGKNGEQVVQYLRKKGFTDEEIKDSGLAMFSEQRGLRSQFWNRVMFPIQDINHRVIGFGGRVMGDGEPKYLNSPETKIFDKSRNLYALNFARQSKRTYMLLCEGYMDVIALHQAGFTARPIRLFLQCDEEVGSRYSQRQSINNMIAEAQQCAAFFNCETARPGKVTLLRKGILKMTVRVHGKAAHAKDYMTGVSALVEAAHKIIRLHERSTADGPTYNCTLAPMEGSSNTVPDVCDIVIDIRVATMAEAREASDFVHQVAAECTLPGASGEVIREGMRPPMEPCEKNQRLFDQVNRICARCGLGQLEPFMSAGGADASNVSQTGVPCLDSFGIEGGAYHTIKEYARLSSIPERAKVLAAVAMYYEE